MALGLWKWIVSPLSPICSTAVCLLVCGAAGRQEDRQCVSVRESVSVSQSFQVAAKTSSSKPYEVNYIDDDSWCRPLSWAAAEMLILWRPRWVLTEPNSPAWLHPNEIASLWLMTVNMHSGSQPRIYYSDVKSCVFAVCLEREWERDAEISYQEGKNTEQNSIGSLRMNQARTSGSQWASQWRILKSNSSQNQSRRSSVRQFGNCLCSVPAVAALSPHWFPIKCNHHIIIYWTKQTPY